MTLSCFVTIYAQENNIEQLPNIVFIISDQHKKDQTGAYGSTTAKTPNIDALAESGVIFSNAYTPAPVCAPARAAIITGMYPYANAAIYHKAPIKMPNGKIKEVGSGYLRETGYKTEIKTIAEVLKDKGYATAAFGKMHVHGELQKNIDEDFPQGNSMGFDQSGVRYYTYFPGGHYQDLVGSDTYARYRQFEEYSGTYPNGSMHLNAEYVPTLVENDEDNFDMVVAREAIQFIEKSASEKKPFFIHIGFEKPHAPFTTTQTYLDMHDPSTFQLPSTANDWKQKGRYPWIPNWIHSPLSENLNSAQNVMAAYNACITEMDDMVGRVIQSLKASGQFENTVIIYTTDHGEHLFEHGLRGKHCMYEEAVNVPLIISYPQRFKEGIAVSSLTSLIDLYPTICGIANAELPETAQGVSLLDALESGNMIDSRSVFSEFRGADYALLPRIKNVPSRMLRTGDYKFVYTHGIVHQLYNLRDDPNELNNLAFDVKYRDVTRDFYFKTMAEWRFQEYSPLEVELKGNKLTWRKNENAESYAIFFSTTSNPDNATVLKSELKTNEFTIKKKGYYWILGDPKLVKTTPRFGHTPVAVEQYNYTLLISDPVHY